MMKYPDEILGAIGVSRETIDRLTLLVSLLEKWNPVINLVSKNSMADAWGRHVLDSAQIYNLAPFGVGHWVDFGSGGGFPGLVIACIAAEFQPEMRLTLIESDHRKAEFLRQACRNLGLSTQVAAERIEALSPLYADVVSARALSSLDCLLAYTQRHISQGGIALFPKGSNYLVDVAVAKRSWVFAYDAIPSKTEPDAVILKVRDLRHV